MDGVTNYLFTQGILGIACLVLGWVCIKLYNKNERLQADKDALNREKLELTESRRVDAVQTTRELMELVQGSMQSDALLVAKIEAVKNQEPKS